MSQYGPGYKTGAGSRKIEPRAHAMNPAGVAQIGSAMGNHATDTGKILHGASVSMDRGRGFEAPKDAGRTVHHGGSQGKR
jgi:hypothetical protein